jgi:hypothetical protein
MTTNTRRAISTALKAANLMRPVKRPSMKVGAPARDGVPEGP